MSNSSIWPIGRMLYLCYHSGPEWNLELWQWRGTLHSPKPQHYWCLTIRLFSVISRTLIGRVGFTFLQRCSQSILQPQLTELLDACYFCCGTVVCLEGKSEKRCNKSLFFPQVLKSSSYSCLLFLFESLEICMEVHMV